jgi:hypothetical protein
MAKDAWKNQPNYKIGGGTINEYEFNQQHGALTEQENAHLPGQGEGATPDAPWDDADPAASPEAQRIRRLTEEAHEKVERRKRKAGGTQPATRPAGAGRAAQTSGGGSKTSGAKKSAEKAAAKTSAKKSAAKSSAKGATKKSGGAKKSGAKKSGAKAGGARKSAKSGSAAKKSSGKRSGARGR